jgi:hypothetical protein
MDVTLLADEHIQKVNEGLSLIQKNNGLTFGTDAYLLAAYVTPEPRALCVDLGRTEKNPLPRPFARFALARYDAELGSPLSGECRIFNSGYRSMRGSIECEDGVVYVTPRLVGFSILMR